MPHAIGAQEVIGKHLGAHLFSIYKAILLGELLYHIQKQL